MKKSSKDSSHARVLMFISMVLDALVTSVTWLPPDTPPVRFHTSHVSTLPNINVSLSAAARTSGTLSGNQASLVAEKYVARGRPHLSLR